MNDIGKHVRSEFTNLELIEILQKPMSALLGISTTAFDALKDVGIETVFDLGVSWLFKNALTVSKGNEITKMAGSLGLRHSDLLKSNAQFETAEDVPNLDLKFLHGLSDLQATALKSALDVLSIREFAYWPPRITAYKLVSDSLGISTKVEESEVLRPKLGEYPTERVYYKSLTMLQMEEDGPRSPLQGAVSLTPTVNNSRGFDKPAVGVLLTTSQSWYAKGITLGHMLHSLALAPGEATRIAVVDWSRRTSASVSESIAETEQLDNATQHARAISEVQNSVAEELQAGGSMSSGWAESSSSANGGAFSTGLLTSILGGGSSSGSSSQSSTTNTNAESTSWSQGSRNIAAEMSQNVNDRTEQHANSVRNRRATAVREVSQSEHESVSTRIIANYNHMHAMTIQYYEVVQVYQVTTQLHEAQRCIFVPFEFLDFSGQGAMDIVERFRGTLVNVALTERVRNLLIDTSTMVSIKPIKNIRFPRPDFGIEAAADINVLAPQAVDGAAGRPSTTATAAATAAAATQPVETTSNAAKLNSTLMYNRDAVLRISKVIGRSPIRPGSEELHLPIDTELLGISFNKMNINTVRIDRPGLPTNKNTFSVPAKSGRIDFPIGILLSDIEDINIAKADDAATQGTIIFHFAYQGRSFSSDYIIIELSVGTSMQKVLSFQTDEGDRQRDLLDHLQANRTYYSQKIFKALDTATLVMLLSPFTWNGKALVDQVEPTPITIAGNYLVFKAPVEANETSGVKLNGANQTWATVLKDRGMDFKLSNARLIPVPTGGVFAEAVLGRSNSAEKLDITRFWNWQDSPIPLQPPEISPVGLGSRGTTENLTPGQLSSPVLNIVNPTSLPDPAGLTASLGAVANGNLFRDMSGLIGTQSLSEAAIRETISASGQAGQLATTNLQTEAQKQVAMSQIAADIAKAAMGIPPTGSTDGISADGALINHGRDMDERGVSNPQGTMSGSGGTGSLGNGGVGSDGGDTTGGTTLMSGSSREAAFTDQSALGFSPAALGAVAKLVAAGAQPASLTTHNSPISVKSEKILKELYPGGEMNNVKVCPYSDNPNPLVRTGLTESFGAWTQDDAVLIYVQDKFAAPSMEHMLKYILKHEAIHVLQFGKKPGANFSFIDMLNDELEDYKDTNKWVNGQQTTNPVPNEASVSFVMSGLNIGEVLNVASNAVSFIEQIKDLKDDFFVRKDFSALKGNLAFLKKSISSNSSEDRCAQIAFIAMDALPKIRKNKVYSVKDLYLQLPNNDPYWKTLGY